MKQNQLRIIVLPYIVRGPLGGLAWHHLQYALGLSKLGHDVYLLEDSDDFPSCYNPTLHLMDTDPSFGLTFLNRSLRRLGLADRWGYYDAHTSRWFGLPAGRIADILRGADMLINVSGTNPIRPWYLKVPVRILVDTDPVFMQVRHLTDTKARDLARQHTAFFTFGCNFGRGRSTIPDDGLAWHPTRQPVVLDAWPVTPGHRRGRLRTVMQWDSYRRVSYRGTTFGMKSESFKPYMDLPRKAGRMFELALGSTTAPRDVLRTHGWILRDPIRTTRTPWTYQRFIRDSKGEFSVSKHGYTVSSSGWFSERSANYLASGRPVIAEETGFSEWLPTGTGVLPFRTPEEALARIRELDERYDAHCRGAREIAVEYFDARKVLGEMIDHTLNSR